MRICVAAPIATADLAPWLHPVPANAPVGYTGAPLTAVLIAELLAAGHQVTALTVDYQLPPGTAPVTLQGPRCCLRVLPGRRRAWRPEAGRPGRALDGWADERAALAQAIRDSAADLVHAHWTYEFALAAQTSGLPHLITAHDAPRQVWRHNRTLFRLVRWAMARQVLRGGSRITAVSDYLANEWRRMGCRTMTVIPNPVAAQALAAGRTRPRPAAPRLGLVANGWGNLKNVLGGLQGFARLRQTCPDATLTLWGADMGPDETAQRIACAQGLQGGLYFRGAVAHRQLLTELAEHDALLHPSLEESFGVVLAEAMALGLPVLGGQDSGAVPWVVGADLPGGSPCAVLVDVRDPACIAEGLIRLLDEHYTGRSGQAMSLARSRYAPAAVAQRYLDCYAQCLASDHVEHDASARDQHVTHGAYRA